MLARSTSKRPGLVVRQALEVALPVALRPAKYMLPNTPCSKSLTNFCAFARLHLKYLSWCIYDSLAVHYSPLGNTLECHIWHGDFCGFTVGVLGTVLVITVENGSENKIREEWKLISYSGISQQYRPRWLLGLAAGARVASTPGSNVTFTGYLIN